MRQETRGSPELGTMWALSRSSGVSARVYCSAKDLAAAVNACLVLRDGESNGTGVVPRGVPTPPPNARRLPASVVAAAATRTPAEKGGTRPKGEVRCVECVLKYGAHWYRDVLISQEYQHIDDAPCVLM